MDKDADLKKLEKRAYRSTFEDGLWDLFLGMIISGFGIAWIGDLMSLPGTLGTIIILLPWNVISILIFTLGKKYITIPRMGIVKFGKRRKRQRLVLIILLALNVFFALVMLILFSFGAFEDLDLSGVFFALIIGLLIITVPLMILGIALQFYRLYIIAILGGMCFFFSELWYPLVGSPFDMLLSFGLIGGCFIVLGLIFLFRFIRKYPKPTEEVVDGN